VSEIPTKDEARSVKTQAEAGINWRSPDLLLLREWLGWRRYELACSILGEADDPLRARMHGQAKMCEELINMIAKP